MSKKEKRLVLLDSHAILHRAYHALPDFTSSKGEPTGALYGLSTMLLKIIADLSPDYIIACYDVPEPTYRHEAFEGYKAGRAKTDDALVAQIIRSQDVFKAFNIPIYERAGFEADDILGTIVEEVKGEKDLDVVIASGDMDTLQLINDNKVRVYTLKKGIKDTIIYNEDMVRERFGFGPELLPDYKGLRGDPSDNIKGVKGIGEKTASELIQKFGAVENLCKAIKKDRSKVEGEGIKPRIVDLLIEHEEDAFLSKELGTIRKDAPIDFKLPETMWKESFEPDKVIALFTDLSFRTLCDRIREEFQGTVPLPMRTQESIPEEEVAKVGIALWLLDSEITNPTLDDILRFARTESFAEAKEMILGEVKKQKLTAVYEEIELPLIPILGEMKERGVLIDTEYLQKLSVTYHKELEKLRENIYEMAGGEFNISSPKQLGDILFEKLQLKPKNQKRTATGQKSTKESELQKLRDLHPIIGKILEYRELQKLLSTYIDTIPEAVDGKNRLHATFIQTGAATGRMSSNNPNLQNIPIRTDLGRAIRNAVVASPGFELLALDYSQIELRVAAFLSGDKNLIDIFKDGRDIHTEVAARVFKVKPGDVDKEMRRRAKVINFGIIYGMGVNALQQNLGTNRAEAQEFLNEYLATFSGLARYLEEMKGFAAMHGYTETLFGRRRHFEGIRSSIPYVKAAAERMAINAPIQGTEADLIKLAMIKVDEYLKEKGLSNDAYLLLQVHDELVYEVKKGPLEDIAKEIKRIMETLLSDKETKGVPIAVEASTGKNWGELKKLPL